MKDLFSFIPPLPLRSAQLKAAANQTAFQELLKDGPCFSDVGGKTRGACPGPLCPHCLHIVSGGPGTAGGQLQLGQRVNLTAWSHKQLRAYPSVLS